MQLSETNREISRMSVKALAGVIGDRHRQVIHAVVDKIVASPGEDYGLQLMKPRMLPMAYLIHEKIAGFGGMTGERAIGEKGKQVATGSGDTRLFKPGAYQEHIKFGEEDLLMLRKLGTIGDRGVTGLTNGELDHLSRGSAKLERRLKNRMNKLAWDALFSGTYVWKGRTFDFAIPGANTIAAATDWSVKATGTPLSDLWTLQSTHALIRIYQVKEFVINPKTAADMQMTQEVRDALKNYNLTSNDINKVAQFLFPGLAPIRIVKDGWQDETVAADGSISMGVHQFFVPDDKVLVVPNFGGSLYDGYGELQITENMNDPAATLDKPAQGIYTFVDEKGLEERESPYVKVVAGFNGGPNLLRSDDVIVITV
jgi:hypothetical protein